MKGATENKQLKCGVNNSDFFANGRRIISLIGMPSSGKTTLAKALSERLNISSIDLDHMVEEREEKSLVEVLAENGGDYFLNMEYGFLTDLDLSNSLIISTPGSMIYHEKAMSWLKKHSHIIHLDVDYNTLCERQKENPKAIVGLAEKGLAQLYRERIPVYEKWADTHVDISGLSIDESMGEIVTELYKVKQNE